MRKTLKRNLSYDDRNHLYYVSLYYDGENGRRVRRTRTYPTMEQAEQVIAEYRRAQLLGGMSTPKDVFVEDWLRYWMDELIKPNCEETTCHGYENILNTHMIPSLGRLCVQDLTPVRVQQYYGELRKKGLANNTIRKHHVLLHAALGAAVRQTGHRGGECDLPCHAARARSAAAPFLRFLSAAHALSRKRGHAARGGRQARGLPRIAAQRDLRP